MTATVTEDVTEVLEAHDFEPGCTLFRSCQNVAKWLAWMQQCCFRQASHNPYFLCDSCKDNWALDGINSEGKITALQCEYCSIEFRPSSKAFKRIEPLHRGGPS